MIAACSHNFCGIVVCFITDQLVGHLGIVGNDEQGNLLVPQIHAPQCLGRCILEDNGIQRLVPTKQDTCHTEHHHVKGQDVVPDITTVFLRKVDGYKISAAAGSSRHKAERNGTGIQKATKNSGKKYILGHGTHGNQVREKAGQ